MPVTKLHKIDTGYDIIPRESVDSLSSADAIAIYTILLTRPQDWVIHKEWLKNRVGIGDDRYAKAIKELKEKGFWEVQSVKDEEGKMAGRIVHFYPIPKYAISRCSGIPEVRENPPLKETENELKIKREIFIPPTVEQVAAYIAERGSHVDAEDFVDFYTSKGWMVGKNKMKDWKACVRTWERQSKKEVRNETSKPASKQDLHREATHRIQRGLQQALLDDGFFGADEADVPREVDFSAYH